ncbi:GNAT family N-acetyltransferase [Hoylesella saccharolytica]|uniref:GNAT family N-acetyltransferase n=1 Tax=Hoylesella saccharolytica TaxID=633701 RepID=UPI0028E8703A|nr:GNAT family N-acetyltransferase [Hoylesella saccharolytica]
MIKFKDLMTDDRQLIQSYTLWGERQNCDLSFANLISWKYLYNTQFAIVNDYLVFRFHYNRHLAYMMPVAKPQPQEDGTFKVQPCDECSIEVIKAIRDDSIAKGHPFLMMGVCNYMRDLIEQRFPDTFDIKPNRDFADYIYTREKLVNLSGKKLQSKRNHINKFKSLYPNYEYRALTPDLIPQCLALEKQWRKVSKDDTDETDLDEELSEELRSMTRAFNRWDRLGLIGGTIWVDNKLVAFTFGCPINQTTFDVCVEKADVNYEGAFTIINQEFVKHLPEKYFYINREEDMGDEGLRRAKESYRPDILLEKNIIMEKYPLADFEDQDRIKEETRELWKLVFNDSEKFMDLYFNRVYQPKYNITCQINRHVVAALQTLPYTLLYHGSEVKTAYISGVSTHPDFRQQGVADNLMRQAHFDLFYKEVVFATLIPAEKWLYEWYGRCGYAEQITCTPPPTGIEKMNFETFDKLQRTKSCVLLHDREGFDIIQEDIRLVGADYHPATQTVQAMIRVVNVKRALELYLKHHPETNTVLRVEDDHDIPMNNAYYILKSGRVKKTDEPDANALRLRIEALADFIFKDEGAEMNLMLNE